MAWYLEALVNSLDLGGRASRSEFWWFQLFNAVIAIVLAVLTVIAALPPLVLLVYSVAMIAPSLTVAGRRLHDIGRSGWWLLVGLVPLGPLVLLFFYVLPGTPGPNAYGPEFRVSDASQKTASRNAMVEAELMRLYALQKAGAMTLEEYQARRRALLSHS